MSLSSPFHEAERAHLDEQLLEAMPAGNWWTKRSEDQTPSLARGRRPDAVVEELEQAAVPARAGGERSVVFQRPCTVTRRGTRRQRPRSGP
jgi:hypothetical protein